VGLVGGWDGDAGESRGGGGGGGGEGEGGTRGRWEEEAAECGPGTLGGLHRTDYFPRARDMGDRWGRWAKGNIVANGGASNGWLTD
jgi:hypothetical protein